MRGEITLYIGCMFAGKTTSLISDLKKNLKVKKKCLCIKPIIDTRYSKTNIVSHNGVHIKAKCYEKLADADKIVENYDIIFVDECNFFSDADIYPNKWADNGKKVIITALNGTYQRKNFGKIGDLIPQCENIIKLKAICDKCSKEASFSKKLTQDKNEIDIGGSDKYIAVCRECYNKN